MLPDNATLRHLKWFAGICLLGVLLIAAYYKGRDSEKDAHAETKAKHAAVLATLAEKTRAAAARARAASDQVRVERAEVDRKYQEDLAHAKSENDRLRDDLRAGRQQLHERWACPVPGAGEGGIGADAAGADAAGRHDSAARVVAAGDADAAMIRWLWQSWQADRRAVIDGGCAIEVAP